MTGDAPRAPDLPAPPLPSDCDLTSYDWFPLKHRRLQQSEWWLSASDLARSRNVDLWAEAYGQVPAASLPDNDVVLARFAGYGRDVEGFREVKAELLAPWTLHADGRWYHPVLVEVAAEAWQTRQAAIAERERDRDRKREKRSGRKAGMSGGRPSDGDGTDAGQASDENRTGVGNPQETALKGQERKGKREADASLSARDARESEDPAEFAVLKELYGKLVIRGRGSPMVARSHWLRLSPADQRALPGAVERYAAAKPWGSAGPPALQRFIGEDIWREFAGASVTSIVWAGPPELRQAVVDEAGEAFARSYLDPATWRDEGRSPTLIALTCAAANRLRPLAALRGVAIQDPILPRKQA